ncbi:carboxypeptidase-like regulatory domain-containing protein [Urechidicola croceus]|uniref:Carboxypeptidase-like regulatory domain-containing protein n=1 Tax=Urechidicola croceus TaxID=1850246 RepID=A0A1D8P5V9_9FLAO|nr:carboxypeptidase-like regulatory domain-containing protein [Urechidicola croceus]AOW19954.1 hypothetical protein LPB138_04315 [Urechidicola croceus]
MKKQLPLIFILISSVSLWGQFNNDIIEGKILYLNNPVSDVHILNTNTNKGTSTDGNGSFEIAVNINDTLIFTHIEYQSQEVIITEEHIKNGMITVSLEIMTNYLNTVNLKNHNLSGSLTLDSKKSEKDSLALTVNLLEKSFINLAKMPSFNDYVPNMEAPILNNVDPTGGGGVGGAVGIPMGNKENLLRIELRVKKTIPDRIINEFGRNYFISELKIPEDKIYHFISYCETKNIFNLFENKRMIELSEILYQESIAYLKIKE